MSEREQAADQLDVTLREDTAYLRLRGRGSFKISKPLKEFGVHAVAQHVTRIVLDLGECIGMDSTFMGVLAGLAFRLRRKNDGALYLINLSPRTRGLLATLGLDQLVVPCMVGETPPDFVDVFQQANALETLPESEATRQETASMMLEAHENLVDILPENRPRFKDVLTFLREDLKKFEQDASDSE